jgi:hypothetical protein
MSCQKYRQRTLVEKLSACLFFHELRNLRSAIVSFVHILVILIHSMVDGLGINVFMLSLYASSLGNVLPYSYRSMPKAHQCESREAFRSLVEENTNAK